MTPVPPTFVKPAPAGHANPALAAALAALMRLQEKHHGAIESKDLTDRHRAILVDVGFLMPVMKGWYVCASPSDRAGDSTAWYATFWPFVAGYLGKRFGERYCLNPEASLLLHTGNTTVPAQVTAVTQAGGTSVVNLPFNTSLLMYPDDHRLPRSATVIRGLQVWSVAEALCLAGPQFFLHYPREAEIALAMVRDPSELLEVLLSADAFFSSAARLAGALHFVGRQSDGDHLIKVFSQPGQPLRPRNPFGLQQPTINVSRERSPYVLRLRSMWASWRQAVIDTFPSAPGIPADAAHYIEEVNERYVADAYNSLSIEGYHVNDELIARVARAGWDPEHDSEQQKDKDALAARGYFQAFSAVKASIAKILAGDNAGNVVQADLRDWYAELFGPAVAVGILQRHQLAGYRTGPIFIRNSKHTPLPRDAILDAMEALFDLIENEPEASVRAVLGHHLFVFIHPYFDGNGRIGRFLMNALFASGGYPWTVVRFSRRATYIAALECASVDGDIRPLAQFLKQEMEQAEV